jgi:hypothetical protein
LAANVASAHAERRRAEAAEDERVVEIGVHEVSGDDRGDQGRRHAHRLQELAAGHEAQPRENGPAQDLEVRDRARRRRRIDADQAVGGAGQAVGEEHRRRDAERDDDRVREQLAALVGASGAEGLRRVAVDAHHDAHAHDEAREVSHRAEADRRERHRPQPADEQHVDRAVEHHPDLRQSDRQRQP